MNSKEKARRDSKMVDMREWSKKPTLSGFESTCIKPPAGYDSIKLPTEGVVRWDFLPYRVGRFNRRADEGMIHCELEYEAHRVPAFNGVSLYLCMQKMSGEKCAVCDWLRKYGGSVDAELTKKLRNTTSRHLWLINDKPGDSKNKLKILDSNHFNKGKGFGEQIADALNSLHEDDDDPFGLVNGSTLQLTCKEETFPQGKYTFASRIDFRKRSYSYPESILDKNEGVLDNCLVFPNYEELMDLLTKGPKLPKEDTAPAPENSVRTDDNTRFGRMDKKDEVEEDSDDVDENDDKTASELGLRIGDTVLYLGRKCSIDRISRDGTSLFLEDLDSGDSFNGIAPHKVKKEEPNMQKDTRKKSPPKKKDEEEDIFDDDEPAR